MLILCEWGGRKTAVTFGPIFSFVIATEQKAVRCEETYSQTEGMKK